jgi:hypothetical protein
MDITLRPIIILIAIPILGAIKNVIKRKTFNIKIFLRTFVVYLGILVFFKVSNIYNFKLTCTDSMLLSLLERWGMFVYKIIYSYFTKNYEKKKIKYWEKYNLELSSNTLDQLDKQIIDKKNN